MNTNSQVLFFDLFFTLIQPEYHTGINEYNLLNISPEAWEAVAEDAELYRRRAIGRVTAPELIIEEIVLKGNFQVSDDKKRQVLDARINRMKCALLQVDKVVIETLTALKENNSRLCLVSNADVIDKMFWKSSPLWDLFDQAIFSCDIGSVKPQAEIYEHAMRTMSVLPENSFFIGDGGSDELIGAKAIGMRTVLSEHLLKRDEIALATLLPSADFHIKDFTELTSILGQLSC